MQALQPMRVYHASPGPATAGRHAAVALLMFTAVLAGPVRALPPVPAPTAGPVQVQLERAIRALFATPRSLLKVVPLHLSPGEEARTLRAMDVLFLPARIEELTLAGVTASGHVDTLRLRLRDVNVFGLRVREIKLVAEDFTVDLARLHAGAVALTGDARTRMSALLLEEDLNRVSPAYRLELRPDDFAVSGRAGVLFIRAGYCLHGRLAATPENQLVFRPRSLSYGILPIPLALYAAQVRRLNPLFDMARFLGQTRGGFDLRFDRVALEDRRCTVELAGTIHAHPLVVETLPPAGIRDSAQP